VDLSIKSLNPALNRRRKMMLRRGSAVPVETILGPFRDFNKRIASEHDPKLMDIFPFFASLVKDMAPTYDISADPQNYVFAQVRALHADKVNGNGDRARTAELIQFRPNLGTFVFNSFIGKPHLEEHDDTDLRTSHGILVHSTIHLDESDKPIRVLVAVDKTKNRKYAEDLEAGKPVAYSMGCTAQMCVCDHCGNLATSDDEWCDHMRTYKGRYILGRLMSESMYAVEYQELSRVAAPADKGANKEFVLPTASSSLQTVNPQLASIRSTIRENLRKLTPWGI